ncbi:drosomycin-like [Drosophila takahashii]|uniref:drosomycin-like n=1 Tax=Drosophila takahashii TaxID=29030 RepID=UPI001CF808D9|nr:drosomycin-like [Drosophila takahashii]
MLQIKYLFALFAILMLVVLGPQESDAVDCLSRRFRGPCAVWDWERCRRICREEERRLSGHCSARLQCWCEGC